MSEESPLGPTTRGTYRVEIVAEFYVDDPVGLRAQSRFLDAGVAPGLGWVLGDMVASGARDGWIGKGLDPRDGITVRTPDGNIFMKLPDPPEAD